MADPVYDGIDVITVTIALVLAAAWCFDDYAAALERRTLKSGIAGCRGASTRMI